MTILSRLVFPPMVLLKLFGIFLIVALLMTGCATGAPAARVDNISFDRGQFGYTVGGLSQMLRTACAAKKLSEVDCARLDEVDKALVKQITAPPVVAPAAGSSVDMDALMRMLMTLGKMAL
jgi:hypothetical protein